MNGFRLPLALSLAAHAIILAVLFLLPTPAPPAAPSPPASGIEVAFAPSLPQPQTPPAPQPVKAEPPPAPPPPPPHPPPSSPPPPPKVEMPAPPPPVAMVEPPPAPEASVVVPEALPSPPPPKPPVPPRRREIVRRLERPMERFERPPRAFAAVPPAPLYPAAPTQQAMLPPAHIPAPAASAAVSPGYASLLGEWLNSHKRYPESARERGEEGRAVLRFGVERNGRVTQFAVVRSSGYPDLDAGLEEMMRGATLPPFPADMPQSSITVSVTIRFSLER